MAQPKRPESARRGLVNIRMSREDRDMIDRAARTARKTRTEFMVEAARRAAHDTLLDTNLLVVDRGTFARFKTLFDAPPRRNDRLEELLRQKAPWE